MTKLISLFVSDLLEYYGSIVEKKGECLEVISPSEVCSILEIPEYAKLCFTPGQSEYATLASYDSELFKSFSRLIADKGKFSEINFQPSPVNSVNREKLEKKIRENVILKNAVFELEKIENKNISYILSYFKYTAISDEKQEGIISTLINEFTLSLDYFNAEFEEVLSRRAENVMENIEKQGISVVSSSLLSAQTKLVKEELSDFINSIERKLNRDINRINEYYHTLIDEINRVIAKKILSDEEKEKYQNKIKSIEIELGLKTQDLIDKYSLNIHIEPVSFIRINIPTQIFWLHIKRRKSSRLFPLAFNPIFKTFDGLPCESCFTPDISHFICDDNLHVLCNQCFRPCSVCGKNYCRACHKDACPKCGEKGQVTF